MSEQNENLPAEQVQELSSQTLFSKDVNDMSFDDLARYNGIMQAVKKTAKSKRSETRSRLEDGLASGDVSVDLKDKGEHSIAAMIPGVNIALMTKEYEKLDNAKAVELLKDKDVDFQQAEENGLVEKSVSIDEKGLLDFLESKGIDYSDYVESVKYDVNAEKLKMLGDYGELDAEEVESCYLKKTRSRFQCTLQSEYKKKVINLLKGVEVSENTEETKEKEVTAETLQEVDGVGPALANRILEKVK